MDIEVPDYQERDHGPAQGMVSPNEYVFGMELPRQRLLGRVIRVDSLGARARGRISYEMAALDAEALDTVLGEGAQDGEAEPFALLRVVTTRRRFRELFNLDPAVGDWLLVQTVPFREGADWPKRMLAWQARLENPGRTHQSRGYLVAAERVLRTDDAGETRSAA